MEADLRRELPDLVRRVMGRVLAERGMARPAPPVAGVHVDLSPPDRPGNPEPAARRPGREVITARCLAPVAEGGSFAVPSGAIVTPAARDEARRRSIRLTGEPAAQGRPPGAGGDAPGGLRIAVGCDHGGFALKLDVLSWLRELGHRPVDLGTHGENAVDYPDFAHAVAEVIRSGQCEIGICIDGAGIGSAMAANKVPGVRAANCHDEATARNAREHNFANVLTLGGKLLSRGTAATIVRTFLSTPWGAERHARRVAKIDAIEARYSRRSTAADA